MGASVISLEKEIEKLKSIIEEQQFIIEELTTPPPQYIADVYKMGLPRGASRVLSRLLRDAGKIVTKRALVAAASFDPASPSSDRVVVQWIFLIRRRIEELRLSARIDTINGVGYMWRQLT